jgi:hypothetical protein
MRKLGTNEVGGVKTNKNQKKSLLFAIFFTALLWMLLGLCISKMNLQRLRRCYYNIFKSLKLGEELRKICQSVKAFSDRPIYYTYF